MTKPASHTMIVVTGIALIAWLVAVVTLSAYQIGKTDGTTYGYTEGLRVADAWETTSKKWETASNAWERRAKECEDK